MQTLSPILALAEAKANIKNIKIYKDYKSWSIDMFTFMDDVVRNITINPSEKLKVVCPHCGKEVVSNVRFPNGIKAIFNVATKAKKFGSR